MITALLNLFRHGCTHRNATWPARARVKNQTAIVERQFGKQVCPDCGRYRFYELGRGPVGGWKNGVRGVRTARTECA